MKIKLNRNRHRGGFQAALWLVVMIFLVFVIIVGGIAYTMVKTLQRVVPQPPPDDRGWVPTLGSDYLGGVVTGYTNGPARARVPQGFAITNVLIYASDDAWPGDDMAHWTNCIWQGPLDQLQTAIGTNGMPMEQWTNGMPPQRFYNFVIQTYQ